MIKTKLRPIGSSTGAIFPREILDRMHVSSGDELMMIPTDNGVLVTPYDPDFERAMGSVEKGRRKYRNALRELAK